MFIEGIARPRSGTRVLEKKANAEAGRQLCRACFRLCGNNYPLIHFPTADDKQKHALSEEVLWF